MENRKLPKKTMIFASALLAGLAMSSTTLAHPGKGKGKGKRGDDKCFKEKHAKLVTEFDANGNGKLEPEERALAREQRRVNMLAKYDKNNDGKLSKEERIQKRQDRMVEKFVRLDANGDAKITAEEAANACGPLGRHFNKADSNGDGSVTRAEFEAGAKRMKRRHRARKHHDARRLNDE